MACPLAAGRLTRTGSGASDLGGSVRGPSRCVKVLLGQEIMPALNTAPLATAVPSLVRRRVQSYPDLQSHSLLVVSPERLHLAPLDQTPDAAAAAAAETGTNPDELLGPLATAVDLDAIRRVKVDLLANAVTVEHAAGGLEAKQLALAFSSPEAADACFMRLWRQLGDRCELLPYRKD